MMIRRGNIGKLGVCNNTFGDSVSEEICVIFSVGTHDLRVLWEHNGKEDWIQFDDILTFNEVEMTGEREEALLKLYQNFELRREGERLQHLLMDHMENLHIKKDMVLSELDMVTQRRLDVLMETSAFAPSLRRMKGQHVIHLELQMYCDIPAPLHKNLQNEYDEQSDFSAESIFGSVRPYIDLSDVEQIEQVGCLRLIDKKEEAGWLPEDYYSDSKHPINYCFSIAVLVKEASQWTEVKKDMQVFLKTLHEIENTLRETSYRLCEQAV